MSLVKAACAVSQIIIASELSDVFQGLSTLRSKHALRLNVIEAVIE